jgi:hypothetical protein
MEQVRMKHGSCSIKEDFYFYILWNFIHHCFIFRFSDSTVSVNAGTLTVAVRRFNLIAGSHPRTARSHPLTSRSHPPTVRSYPPQLDLIHPWLDLIRPRLDFIHPRLDIIPHG